MTTTKKLQRFLIIDFQTEKGFELAYHQYSQKLFRIAFNIIKDRAIVEELVQNVYCSLWEKKDSLELKGPLENYIVRAVKLAALDHIRTKMTHQNHLRSSLAEHSKSTTCTENQVMFNELSQTLLQLTEQLPHQCRQVFRLSREKGMTIREISSALFIAEKTVEAHLTKALKFLRKELSEYR